MMKGCLICLALILAAGPSRAFGESVTSGSGLIGGEYHVDEFFVSSAERLLYDGDLIVRSDGDIVIEGEIIGLAEGLSSRGSVHAPTLVLESQTSISVKGVIRGSDGRHGSLSSIGEVLLGQRRVDTIASEPVADGALRESLERGFFSGDPGIAFVGGDGGSIVLRAPVVWVDGLVQAGNGGDGGPCGRGGAGGAVELRPARDLENHQPRRSRPPGAATVLRRRVD